MRQQMLTRKIFKKPGCSWIEVDGVVHEFLVEDKTHDARKEIYETLEYMTREFKMDVTSSSWEQNCSFIFVDGEIIV
uniref:Uncharacterized protein n=1 Tax=Arundo donax TaxID=35708 RepID=A0A0A9DVW6_ARUDO